MDSNWPIRSSRKPSTFSVAMRPPDAWAASRTVVVTPALVSRCAAESPATPAPTIDDVRLVRGLKHVPLLEVARPVETSCPQQAPGIPEFGSRVGP